MSTQELGYQVLRRRKELGISQAELAERAEISRNYVSLIERGEAGDVSGKVLKRLADALGVTPYDLAGPPVFGTVIPPALREFGLQEGLSFDTIDWLARMPRRGPEPKTAEEWRQVYDAIRPYIEGLVQS